MRSTTGHVDTVVDEDDEDDLSLHRVYFNDIFPVKNTRLNYDGSGLLSLMKMMTGDKCIMSIG